jgi:hypothetical protein
MYWRLRRFPISGTSSPIIPLSTALHSKRSATKRKVELRNICTQGIREQQLAQNRVEMSKLTPIWWCRAHKPWHCSIGGQHSNAPHSMPPCIRRSAVARVCKVPPPYDVVQTLCDILALVSRIPNAPHGLLCMQIENAQLSHPNTQWI